MRISAQFLVRPRLKRKIIRKCKRNLKNVGKTFITNTFRFVYRIQAFIAKPAKDNFIKKFRRKMNNKINFHADSSYLPDISIS